MTFLIDGFNLIYKFPDLEALMYENRLNDARDGLLDKLKRYLEIKPKTIFRVVFDGKRNPGDNLSSEKKSKIDIYYSLQYSADFLIKEFIKKDLHPKNITVVTSDKEILFYINRFRAKKMTSEEFAVFYSDTMKKDAAEKEPEKDTDPHLSKEELSYWQKLFKK
jgi:uncharacterized protein